MLNWVNVFSRLEQSIIMTFISVVSASINCRILSFLWASKGKKVLEKFSVI